MKPASYKVKAEKGRPRVVAEVLEAPNESCLFLVNSLSHFYT